MTTGADTKGVLVVYRGCEWRAIDAAAKHAGMKKTVTPHDAHLERVALWWMTDKTSPRQTGDYSNWEDEEVKAMNELVERLY